MFSSLKRWSWRALWLLILVPFMTTHAQLIDPTVHIHPQDAVIGMTDGRVFETYTLDFQLINQFKLLDDPSVTPIGYNFQWSPDGSKLAVYLYGVPVPPRSTVLQIWDTTNQQKLYEIPGVEGTPTLAWSPDGSKFAALIYVDELHYVIRIYNAADGQIILEIPAGHISRLEWSPHGDQLIYDNYYNVKIISADTGLLLRTLDAMMNTEQDIAFSPTQNRLAFINLNDNDNDLEIWNTDTGELVQKLQGHTQFVTGIAWNTGGLVSTGLDDTIRIWNPQSGQQIKSFQVGRYPDAELSADGTKLLIEDKTTGIHIRDAETGDVLAVFGNTLTPTPTLPLWATATPTELVNSFNGADWSPSGDRIALFSDKQIVIYRNDLTRLTTIDVPSSLLNPPVIEGVFHEIKWSPDGKLIAAHVVLNVGEGNDDTIIVWNIAQNHMITRWEYVSAPFDWSVDSRYIATTDEFEPNLLHIYDISQSLLVNEFRTNTNINALEWNPVNNNQIAVSAGQTFLLNPFTMQETGVIAESSVQDLFSYSPDGQYLAITGQTTISIWDTSTLQKVTAIPYGPPNVALIILAWGNKSLSLSYDNSVRLWNVFDQTYRTIFTPSKHTRLFWKPDGSEYVLVTGTRVAIYDAVTGEVIAKLP